MNNLSPSAQLVVRGAAKAARPSDADRARIFEALRGRLGDAAMLGQASSAAVPSAAASGAWLKLSAVTLGVGLAVGGAFYGLRSESQAVVSPAASVVVQVAPPETPAPQTEAALPVEVARATPPSAVEPPAASARRPSDRLAEEVALLSRATSALRAGRASDALKALNEHQTKFPKAVLSEERRAARAQALCALGQRAEGERELAKLPRSSPQAARVRQLCGAAR